MDHVAAFPQSGRIREDFTSQPLLFWPVWQRYWLVYRGASPVEIIRVVHAARDIRAIFGE